MDIGRDCGVETIEHVAREDGHADQEPAEAGQLALWSFNFLQVESRSSPLFLFIDRVGLGEYMAGDTAVAVVEDFLGMRLITGGNKALHEFHDIVHHIGGSSLKNSAGAVTGYGLLPCKPKTAGRKVFLITRD